MTPIEISKILRDRKIKAAGGFSDKEIDKIIRGIFTVPKFDSKTFSDIGKSNPALKSYLLNIQKTLNNLENQYLGKTLQTEELPDIIIGD